VPRLVSGFHVFAFVLGASPTPDHIYVDGTECAYWQQKSDPESRLPEPLSRLRNVGLWANRGFDGNVYRASFMALRSRPPGAIDERADRESGRAARGRDAPVNALLATPQLHCIGDSITYGRVRRPTGAPTLRSRASPPIP